MASLGHKGQAIDGLNRIRKKYGAVMAPDNIAEYEKRLSEAAKW